jgi:hypothetical protein
VTSDIEAIHSEVGAEHPYAANRILEVVRKMFNWGKVAGLVPRDHANPAVGIVRFRERKRKRFITTMEMPRFINALEQEDNDYARHGIWLLVLMGVRSNELLKGEMDGPQLGHEDAVCRLDEERRAFARAAQRGGARAIEGHSENGE